MGGVFYSMSSYSQTVQTFNINYNSLGTSDICNPFASNPTIGGFTHYSTIAYPFYYGTSGIQAVALATGQAPSGQRWGTEYSIGFNFKKINDTRSQAKF